MADTKNVFISYSWDDDAHKDWVRRLAERLVANGVHAHLDQWDVRPGHSLTQFMDLNLPRADFSLVVCTPRYAQKSINRDGGAGYEAQIITAQIASGIERSKFVPIIRSGSLKSADQDCAIPPHFAGIFALDMRDDASIDKAFEDLLRHIYDEPALRRPTLGERPVFGEIGLVQARTPLRLANLEIEHWELASGVVRNELYPDTFEIPDEASRRTVKPGDVVKLSFEYIYPDDAEEEDTIPSGERMWVLVTGTEGPYYVGTLSNAPICTVDWHSLEFGDTVVFLPEHVISLDRDGADAEISRQHDEELTEIIGGFIKDAGLRDIDADDVKLIIKRLEEESGHNPEKTHTEVWKTIVERLNLGEAEFSVAEAIWHVANTEDDIEDETA